MDRVRLVPKKGRGGKKPKGLPYKEPRFDPNYYICKEATHTRDGHKCVHCGISREEHRLKFGSDIILHHIKEWDEYPELRFVVDNCLTLCYTCHKKEHVKT